MNLSFISKLFALIMMTLTIAPAAEENTSGPDAYVNYPVNVNGAVSITIPYVTNANITLTYRYEVYNASNVQVSYIKPIKTSLLKDATLLIQYVAPLNVTSVGVNLIRLFYKASHHSVENIHSSYFYGYTSGTAVSFNNLDSAIATMANEKVFEYHGYSKRTVQYYTTTLYRTNLNGFVFCNTDLFFDFTSLYFTLAANYTESFYMEARLYFEDATLFPFLNYSNGLPYVIINLTKTDYLVTASLKDSLYVDSATHLVSASTRTGFNLTNKLYFPKSRFGEINNTPARLEISGFGFSKFNITYRFYVDVDQSFLGTGGNHEIMIDRY